MCGDCVFSLPSSLLNWCLLLRSSIRCSRNVRQKRGNEIIRRRGGESVSRDESIQCFVCSVFHTTIRYTDRCWMECAGDSHTPSSASSFYPLHDSLSSVGFRLFSRRHPFASSLTSLIYSFFPAAPMPDDQAMDGGTCVEAILRAFNGPISEEQAWALCYQTVRYVCRPLPASLSTRDLFIFSDGSVRIRNHASGMCFQCPFSPCFLSPHPV